jgi:hypothetical protein
MKKCFLYAIVLAVYILTSIQSNTLAGPSEMIARHQTDTPIYSNKTRITLSTTIVYSYTDIASLGLEISIPENWKFISFSNSNLSVEEHDGIISTYWVDIPESVYVQYDVEIPENETDVQTISALVKYRRHGIDEPLYADVLPDPLQLASSGYFITATAGTGGQIMPSGTLISAANQSLTFSIQPDVGYTTDSIFVNGESVSFTNNELQVLVTSDKNIDIAFRKKQLMATHYCESHEYEPQIPLVIQSRIENPEELNISALSMRVSIPFQWSLISTNGANPPDETKMNNNIINFVWISGRSDDVFFSYTLQPPSIAAGEKTISAEIVYRGSDNPEQTTSISPDISLNRFIVPDTSTIQGLIYLENTPAPYTAQVDVSLLYLDENDNLIIIDTKSDGPNYMLNFIDPGVETYTVLATYSGYLESSTLFSKIPENHDFNLSNITDDTIKITEIQEPESLATTVYEKELSTVQIGNTSFISGQQLEAQTKDHDILATIIIETGDLKQRTSSPAVISYTLREGITSTSSYVSKSNGNIFEISILNADIDQVKGLTLTIPIQPNLSILDFKGDKPSYAVFHASNTSALFEEKNIMPVPPEDLIEINDQGISFITRSLSIFSVGEMIYQDNNDITPTSSDDSGGGCFIEIVGDN